MSKPVRRPRKKAPTVPASVKLAVEAALDKKAIDLVLLDMRDASSFTDFFLICTGTNVRQVQAIANAVEETLREHDMKPALIEGYERADWILIDYFSFIVHVFTPQTRSFYALERLWGDAERIDVSDAPVLDKSPSA